MVCVCVALTKTEKKKPIWLLLLWNKNIFFSHLYLVEEAESVLNCLDLGISLSDTCVRSVVCLFVCIYCLKFGWFYLRTTKQYMTMSRSWNFFFEFFEQTYYLKMIGIFHLHYFFYFCIMLLSLSLYLVSLGWFIFNIICCKAWQQRRVNI